jgi:hypothetical protein
MVTDRRRRLGNLGLLGGRWAGRARARGVAIGIAIAVATAHGATAYLQLPGEPSPESGTAQVVAQGVVAIDDGDLQWRVVERTAPPPANAADVTTDTGFLVVDSGVLLVEERGGGTQLRLPAGEAALTLGGSEQTHAALGSDNAVYYALGLAPTEGGSGDALFVSDPFTGPGASHDLDLLQDTLAPGGTTTIPAGALPTLVLLTAGSGQVSTEAGDVISLAAGEAVSLSGQLVVTGGENGAAVSAVVVGPAVPRLAQVAATPAVRTVATEEPAVAATLPATPAAPAPAGATEGDPDEDGDGLTASQEAEQNTDPALADTDEDGLSDGDEVLSVGTAPLAPDTDGDGVLDGDEVLQGTNPLDEAVAEAAVVTTDETAPGEEAEAAADVPAAEPAAPAEAANPLDGDGDGLEDTIEFELGTDPFDGDTDDDGALDGDEYYVHATGTRNPDTDGDGVLDGDEIANGTNPNDPNSF